MCAEEGQHPRRSNTAEASECSEVRVPPLGAARGARRRGAVRVRWKGERNHGGEDSDSGVGGEHDVREELRGPRNGEKRVCGCEEWECGPGGGGEGES